MPTHRARRRLRVFDVARRVACLLPALAAPAHAQVQTSLRVVDGNVYAQAQVGSTLYIGGSFASAGPATGGFVSLSPATGLIFGAPPLVDGPVMDIEPDGAGGWFIGGSFEHVGGVPRRGLAHLMSNQTLSAWNPGVAASFSTVPVNDLLLHGGTLFVGGSFDSAGGQPRSRLAAIHPTTGAVLAWNPGVRGPGNSVQTMAASGGTLFVGGEFDSVGASQRLNIAAIDAVTGSVSAWNPVSTGAGGWEGTVSALLVSGTTVYAAGRFSNIGGQPRVGLAALSATTGLATSWYPGAITGNNVNALALSGGTLYIGGWFSGLGGLQRNNLAAVDAVTGGISAWNPDVGGIVSAVAPNGASVLIGGSFSDIGGTLRSRIGAVDAATGVATSWAPSVNGSVQCLVVSSGAVRMGGVFTSVTVQPRWDLAALSVVTGQVMPWNPPIIGGEVWSLAVADDAVYIGGYFGQVGGEPRQNIAALDRTTGALLPWNPNANGPVRALELAHGVLYAAGDFSSIGGQSRARLAALNRHTGLATAWNPGALLTGGPSVVRVLRIGDQAVYVAGNFTHLGGQARGSAGAVDAAGTVLPWNPNIVGEIASLLVDGDRVYLGGLESLTFPGAGSRWLGAVDATTGAVLPWNPGANGAVRAIAVGGGHVYVGGFFQRIGTHDRPYFAELDPVTAAPTAFAPDVNNFIYTLRMSGARLFVSGQFDRFGGYPMSGIAEWIHPGALDADTVEPPQPAMLRVHPNPASGPVRIEYVLREAGHVRVDVYDLQGRRVARPVDGLRSGGRHETFWAGPEFSGASGVYLVVVEAAGRRETTRLVRLRP